MIEKITKKKVKNQVLVTYMTPHVTENTRRRVDECGSWVEFVTDKEKGKRKIQRANFCKNRFCPICAWRQAQKDALKIGVMMEYMSKERDLAFIMVTLTAPSVTGENLPSEVTRYNKAYKNMVDREEIVKINRGYIRKLEITYNEERNDYHPHFHCIFAVNKSYFTSRDYIKQEKWLKIWCDVMKDECITQGDVRRVKLVGSADGREGSPVSKGTAVNEVAKYAAKDSDYMLNTNVFDTFYKALKGRQVLTFNGAFKEANAMYKAGELSAYISRDSTEYCYMLLYQWGNGEYIEKGCRELNEDERRLINGQCLDGVELRE